MKCSTILTGKRAEEHAVSYLKKKFYKIIDRNWRYKKAELDIIAIKKEVLVFVEVKSRSYSYFGEPETAVNEKKAELIFAASQAYMEKTGHLWAIRFDIISIILDKEGRPVLLKHIKDVFF